MAKLVSINLDNNAEPCILYYTTRDNKKLSFDVNAFGTRIVSHT